MPGISILPARLYRRPASLQRRAAGMYGLAAGMEMCGEKTVKCNKHFPINLLT